MNVSALGRSPLFNKHVELLLLGGITTAAALLRFYKLGEWSFWSDEIFSISGMEDGFNYSILRQSFALSLIQFTTAALGVNEWSARLAPAIIGMLTIPLLYFPLRKACGPSVAVIATGLLALSPWHLYWSQNARFYSLLFLFYSLGLLFFFLGLEEDRPWFILGSLIFFGLAVRERLVGLFFLPVILSYLCLLLTLRFEKPAGLRPRNLVLFFGPGMVLGLLFAWPFLSNFGGWMQGFGRVNNNPFWLFAGVFYYVGLPVVCMGAFGGLYLLSKRDRSALLFGLGALLPLLTLAAISLFQYTANRYVFFTLTSWIILASLSLKEIFRYFNHRANILAVGVLFLLLGTSFSEDLLYFQYQNGNRDNWKAAFRYVQDHKQPGDTVISTIREVGNYYLGEQTYSYYNWAPENLAMNRRAWFVEDMNVADLFPHHLIWLEENAQQVAIFDVHANARHFKMRVYLYDPDYLIIR